MQKFKRIGTVAVAASLALLAACSTIKRNEPLDERYIQAQERILFIPAYNEKQPNKIVIETTKEVLDWMKNNGFDKKADDRSTYAEELTKKIASEKKIPFGNAVNKYLDYLKNDNRDFATAKDFLDMEVAVCLEKSVFLATILREQGIPAQIFGIQNKDPAFEVYFKHMFVVAMIDGKKMILDPLYGIIEKSLSKYKSSYLKNTDLCCADTRVFPMLKYDSSYEKYIKDEEKEKELDELPTLKAMKKKID